LAERHNINLCYERLRKILIDAGLHEPIKEKIYRKRKSKKSKIASPDRLFAT